MKISAKDVIFGGLWGLVSGLIVLVMAAYTTMAGGSLLPRTLKDLFFTLIQSLPLLPGYLSLWLLLIIDGIFGRIRIPFTNSDTSVLLPLISIVLGIIIVNKAPALISKIKAIRGAGK